MLPMALCVMFEYHWLYFNWLKLIFSPQVLDTELTDHTRDARQKPQTWPKTKGRRAAYAPCSNQRQDICIQRKCIDPEQHPFRFLDTHSRLFPQYSPVTWRHQAMAPCFYDLGIWPGHHVICFLCCAITVVCMFPGHTRNLSLV